MRSQAGLVNFWIPEPVIASAIKPCNNHTPAIRSFRIDHPQCWRDPARHGDVLHSGLGRVGECRGRSAFARCASAGQAGAVGGSACPPKPAKAGSGLGAGGWRLYFAMPVSRRVAGGLSAAAGIAAIAGTVGAQAPRQTFRTTTRLVEVSVVVTDGAGKPVEGLTRDDFTLVEDGVRQPISIFEVNDLRAASMSLPIASRPEGSRTFTNRSSTANGTSTVILLDRLNAGFDSQWFARKHVSGYLESMRPGDRAALYLLDGPLRVLHDFTDDREALRQTLDRYTLRQAGHYDASNEAPTINPAEGIAVWLADPTGNVAEFFQERRSFDTFAAFTYLARHLAGTAGRKSIVWVSEAFAIPTRSAASSWTGCAGRCTH